MARASVTAPSVSSISADDRIAPIGLATFFPASGGAEPCTGSKSDVRPGWMLPDAAMPRPPCSAPPMSVMMSPNRLLVTITWYCPGSFTRNMASASMYWCEAVMPGYSAATSLYTRCHRAWPCCMALLLSAMHTLVWPLALAYSNACRMMRLTPLNVLISSWMAISSGVPALKRPPTPTYTPSVFSRNTTKFTSARPRPLSGHRRSSIRRTGR